jgi:hypothetical protein
MATVGFLFGGKMNRKQRRAAEKIMGKDATSKINLFLSIPDTCLTCDKKFDKKDRDMANTWTVEVFNEQKRVVLYCPECQEKRTK